MKQKPLPWTRQTRPAPHRSCMHARTRNPTVVDALHSLGANLNHQDNDGWGGLHRAAFVDHEELFKHLVALGVDPTLSTVNGNLAYMVARPTQCR